MNHQVAWDQFKSLAKLNFKSAQLLFPYSANEATAASNVWSEALKHIETIENTLHDDVTSLPTGKVLQLT